MDEAEWQAALERMRVGLRGRGYADFDANATEALLETPQEPRERFLVYLEALVDELELRSGRPARVGLDRLGEIAEFRDPDVLASARFVETGADDQVLDQRSLSEGEDVGAALEAARELIRRVQQEIEEER